MTKSLISSLISDLPEIYQSVYGHPELSTAVSRQCTDRLNDIAQVHDSLQYLQGRQLRVLDLGCAQGFFSLSLAARGATVHGVDFLDKNIAVCNALAAENSGLRVSFEVARIENVIHRLEADQYDLVLGLSVFHHLIHVHGVTAVRDLLEHAARLSGALVLEFALREEPLYWGPAQPSNPRSLLDGCSFTHEISRHKTHLSPLLRPLYIASNGYWVLDGLAGRIDAWTSEPHSLANETHEGTRRYYYSGECLVKLLRFDHQRGAHNRAELAREIEFLANPPAGFPAPTTLTSGINDTEGWVVFRKFRGRLLLDLLRDGTGIDRERVLRSVLEQLATLEAVGLYHDDVRTWNVLVEDGGGVCIIDYGSISSKMSDCSWPGNPFLAFFIFVNEVATGAIEDPYPLPMRTVSISPYNLPQPYSSWAASLWKRPLKDWSFRLMCDSLSVVHQEDYLVSPKDVWAKAIESAIQSQNDFLRRQTKWNEAKINQAEAKARQAEIALEEIHNSSSWQLISSLQAAQRSINRLLRR